MCSPRRRSTNVRSSPSERIPGHTTASLLIARLHASSRLSTLAKALYKCRHRTQQACVRAAAAFVIHCAAVARAAAAGVAWGRTAVYHRGRVPLRSL
jgi:hypothetical protein